MKIKLLFLIHDLAHGGAEKVLVNLVNCMDSSKFDITVMTLFDVGVNRDFLAPHIHYKTCFRYAFKGNSHALKLLTPKQLHRWLIKDHYDIEISYLEGPSARVISGCEDPTVKLVSWIHCTMHSSKEAAVSFRNVAEAMSCYNSFHRIVAVSEEVKKHFSNNLAVSAPLIVLYNINESDQIIRKSHDSLETTEFLQNSFKWCGMGKIIPNKGFDRMLRIQKRLLADGYKMHFYILGDGPQRKELEAWCLNNGIADSVTFLGYQTNPYKYVAKCDLFVCASHAEGFSTAATEALIVGTPVCTVEVSGMKEMLGEHNEYGVVVQNDEEALYCGIKKLLDSPELLQHYKQKALERGKMFSTENTVRAVEDMLTSLL